MDKTVTAYVLAIAVALALLLIAAIIASIIKYEPGANPKDPRKRKIWFWVLGILNPIVSFCIGFFTIYPGLRGARAKSGFLTSLGIGIAIAFVLYIILGFVLSKLFKNKKIGHWF